MGGVSGRAGAKAGGSSPSASDTNPSRVVTVEGIPVFGKAALFAGRRRNGGLGRRGGPRRVSSRSRRQAYDSGCPKVAEEGNAVGMRNQAHAPGAGTSDRRMRKGTASFARSFDPCTSILTMLRGASLGGEAFEGASRSGKPAQAGGTGTGASADGRSAARRVSPLPPPARVYERTAWHDEEKEGDRGLRPCEERESGFGCPHVVTHLQKSVGDGWSRISSANALQKERSGSSERGPSSERGSAGETVGRRVERKGSSRVGLTAQDGRGPAQDPG